MRDELIPNPFAHSTVFAGKNLCIGVCGSVAAYKVADLCRNFIKTGINVAATLTAGAERFVTPLLFRALGANPVYHGSQFDINRPFAHLEPGQNADSMLIAPASANFMARLAAGFADDLLAAQALAFPGPVTVAPAMNPRMWQNPATHANAKILRERGVVLVDPDEGATACGEHGKGRLAAAPDIFLAALRSLAPSDLSGLKVMVTLGPTREPWDGIRFWSNPSSGRMGAALATAAWLRGAETVALRGPGVNFDLPTGVKRVDVQTAAEMNEAARDIWPDMDWGLFSAAVCDYAPVRPPKADDFKYKKGDVAPSIAFARTPDILANCVSNKKPSQKTLGFAAEITADPTELKKLTREKLAKKELDLIAGNLVNKSNSAFGADQSELLVADRDGLIEAWPLRSKADSAWELCSWLSRI